MFFWFWKLLCFIDLGGFCWKWVWSCGWWRLLTKRCFRFFRLHTGFVAKHICGFLLLFVLFVFNWFCLRLFFGFFKLIWSWSCLLLDWKAWSTCRLSAALLKRIRACSLCWVCWLLKRKRTLFWRIIWLLICTSTSLKRILTSWCWGSSTLCFERIWNSSRRLEWIAHF